MVHDCHSGFSNRGKPSKNLKGINYPTKCFHLLNQTPFIPSRPSKMLGGFSFNYEVMNMQHVCVCVQDTNTHHSTYPHQHLMFIHNKYIVILLASLSIQCIHIPTSTPHVHP